MGAAERSVEQPEAAATRVVKRVVVAGDLTVDWNLARTRKLRDGGTAWNAEDRTEVYGRPGGAAMLARLIRALGAELAADGVVLEVTGPEGRRRSYSPEDPHFHHHYAVWSQFPHGRRRQDSNVWRVEEFLGLDRAREPQPVGDAGPDQADLVVLDDAALGFREDHRLWPRALGLSTGTDAAGAAAAAGVPPADAPWVLLKMTCPIADGDLWRQLLSRHARRLVVVMNLNDLRLSDVNISRELSWERTAGDLAHELLRNPAVNGLAHCAHVIASVGTGGAVVLSRREDLPASPGSLYHPDCHLVFDPEAIENSWAEQHPGKMLGYTACLTAGIARAILLRPDKPDVQEGARRGLAAGRALHLQGYGGPHRTPDRAGLTLPASDIARELQQETAEFATALIEQPVRDSWSILEARNPEGLETAAAAVAREGVEVALSGVPIGRFAELVTVDRGETEGFRSIRALMREYITARAPRPLNIAVFGPPGAGKSFGVRAVAKSALDKEHIEDLQFNLSQMRDATDLADAFHQVRDAGLRGRLPFVLWDEFDCNPGGRPYGWLRLFLAPMQDGAFQEGQILHPIGRAIFVFAGGTSSRLGDFAGNATAEFRLAKGPDFVSRLKGHVDIVGPDPRNGDPEADPYFRIRRAILLRSVLLRERPGLFARHHGESCLQIDSGVLRAFLEVSAYRHGARSLETIVSMSALSESSRYERSALPAADQLDAHVDAREFLELVDRYVPEGDLLERLAEAVHVNYCAGMLGQGYTWAGSPESVAEQPSLKRAAETRPTKTALSTLVDYKDLSEHDKEQNRDAARGAPRKLAVLGYILREDAPAGAPDVVLDPSDPRIEFLARREHERWLRRRQKAGWRYGSPRDDARKLHPSVLPWDELPEDVRDVDRRQILGLPAAAAAAGLTVAQLDDVGEVKIGIAGHRFLAEPERIAAGIEAALGRLTDAYPGRPLALVSALAEGADRLAVEPAIKKLGARLIAVLPLPKADYMRDFQTAESKAEFERLLHWAEEKVELPARDNREEAYAAAGDAVLDRADVLLTVWDGQGAQGLAGTGKVVARARARGIPIAWVHAGNRKPGTTEPTSLGPDQGRVTYENL
jgi:hypothetical protein